MASLFRSSAVVSLLTLLSRVLGLLRDLLIAAVFGAGAITDVFFVAFLIPNMFRRIFAEGAFSKGFIPVFNQVKSGESVDSLRVFASSVFWRLLIVVVVVVVIGVFFAPQIIPIFAQRFVDDEDIYVKSIALLRIMFPYLLFITVAAYLTGILNSYQRFALPALGPVLLNVVMVMVLLFASFSISPQILWLSVAVVAGGLLHVGVLVLPVMRLGFVPIMSFQSHASVKRVMMLMLPVILGSSAIQINQIVNTQLNTSVGAGAASWFYYADRLFQFPVGMFGVAVGSVVLPRLSQAMASGSVADFDKTLDWALRCILIVAIPSAIGIGLLSYEMTLSLYQRGEFSLEDVAMTARALTAMSFAVVGYMLVQVLSAAHYAQQDTKKPAVIGVLAVCINILVGLSLVSRLGHVATALAVSVSAVMNAFLLAITLPEAKRLLRNIIVGRDGWRIALAALLLSVVLLLLNPQIDWWSNAGQAMRFMVLFGIIVCAGGIYMLALFFLGVPLRQFLKQQ